MMMPVHAHGGGQGVRDHHWDEIALAELRAPSAHSVVLLRRNHHHRLRDAHPRALLPPATAHHSPPSHSHAPTAGGACYLLLARG
eukprot:886603-Rhodomonas_salina.3